MALLLVPLVTLIGLWAFAAVNATRDVLGLMDVTKVSKTFGFPIQGSIAALQMERRTSLLYLSAPKTPGLQKGLKQIQAGVDLAVGAVRAASEKGDDRSLLGEGQLKRLDAMMQEADKLSDLRSKVDSQSISRLQAYDAYTRIIDPGYFLFSELSTIDNVELAQQTKTLVELSRARDAISREDALVTAALASGRMSGPEFREFADSAAEQRLLHRIYIPELPRKDLESYQEFTRSDSAKALAAIEDRMIDSGVRGTPRATSFKTWDATTKAVLGQLDTKIIAAGNRYNSERAEPYRHNVIVNAIIVGSIGLIAVIASFIVSVRVGRGLVRDLNRLRTAALDLAGNRLPRVMRRLAAGEEVDTESEAPAMEFPGDDEIGQVGQAFNDVQRAAVEAAVRQAELRHGISEVFVNLARRSQVLLHRQLTLLDGMERRTEDAEELADLFRLDHMTTRMRRHAEGLVILSGVAPSRAWRNPVMLINVVRAAVAEVEDYERVEVRRMPRVALVGAAVGDVTHLVAELVENATVFSPPHTQVHVHGERVANGFVLEVDDRGLGLSPDVLLQANQRLAETPEFELSDTDRLGLFVVSRLAQRHGIRVSLRPSAYGGTTAVVLLPSNLLTEEAATTPNGQLDPPATPAGAIGSMDHLEPVRPEQYPGGHQGEEAFRQWGLGPMDGTVPSPEPERHDQVPDLDSPVYAQGGDYSDGLPKRHRRRSPVLVADRGRPVDLLRERMPRMEEEPAPASYGQHGQQGQAPGGPSGPVGAVPEPQSGHAFNSAGLPRRVRQASLAPQLRAEATDSHGSAVPAPPAPAASRDRSADEVRARMASLQRGWQRGRRDADDGDQGRAFGGPDASRARTEEGDGR